MTYTLVVLMPPNAPTLEVQFTTATSIRLHWTHPEDGGALIQGTFRFIFDVVPVYGIMGELSLFRLKCHS